MKIFRNVLLLVIGLVIIGILVIFFLKTEDEDVILEETDEETILIDLGALSQITSSKVKVSNNNVYINSGGNYELTGLLNNGTVYIDASAEVTLNLNGVTIISDTSSVIDNRKSSRVNINLLNGTTNILSDGSSSTSAIKSVGDLYLSGNGNLLLYGNNSNGITVTNSNLVIEDITLYVIANQDAFNVYGNFLINSGTVLGFGNNKMQPPSSSSKQNTLLLNFATTMPENIDYALVDASGNSLLNFTSVREYKTLTLSIDTLTNGNYRLLQNIVCDSKSTSGIYKDCDITDGEEVKINITNTFIVDAVWNWYGPMDIIINVSGGDSA